MKDPVNGDRFKSFDPEGSGVFVEGVIREDGTIYITGEGEDHEQYEYEINRS